MWPPGAQGDTLEPNLIAFAAYIAGQIASTSKRKRGHGEYLMTEVQGDLKDHDHWNAGIAKTLKWMKDRAMCPTRDVLLLKLQNHAANAAKP